MMTQTSMIDHIDQMDEAELQRNLRDAYGMTTAMSREMDMLHRVRVELTAENAKLRAELAEALEALYEAYPFVITFAATHRDDRQIEPVHQRIMDKVRAVLDKYDIV